MQLTQKETMLISDMKGQEKLCIEKYTKASAAAHDPQLKALFSDLASVEQTHLQTLNEIESGNPPTPSAGSSQSRTFNVTYTANSPEKQQDAYLCSDLLATEKHASALYDTCVFEFTDQKARNILNHIQKEEQEHGKAIYDYMKANGMYS